MSSALAAASLILKPEGYSEGRLQTLKPIEKLGSELVTNGDFVNGSSNWSTYTSGSSNVVFSDDVATINIDGSNSNVGIYQENVFSSGVQYRIVLRAKGTSSFDAEVLESQAAVLQQAISSFSLTTSYQDFVFTHTANGTNDIFIHRLFSASGANESIIIDNVSIKEVLVDGGDFTFTRGSNLSATRVNSAGLIEKGRENLFKYSNQFDNAIWQGYAVWSSGQVDKDGGTSAWTFAKNNASASDFYNDTTTNGVQTFSIYAKKQIGVGLKPYFFGSSNGYATFNLEDGSVYSTNGSIIIDTNVETYNSLWWRISVTINGSSGNWYLYVTDGTDTQTTDVITLQDAQLEAGMVATDYIETGASTVKAGILENTPRLDYSGGATEPSLLLEPQRSNLMNHSEYFGDAAWNTATSRSYNLTYTDELNPMGLAGSYKYESTDTDNQLANVNYSAVAGTAYTNSIYVKRVSGTGDVRLRDVNNTGTDFSLSAADGWKRIDVTATASGTTGRLYLNLDDTGDEILVWGAQQEVGSYPTSYIPTYGSSETRSKDTGSLDMITAGITTGLTSATLFIEYEKPYTGEGVDTFRMHGTSTNGRAYIYNTGVGFSSDWAIAGGHTIGETTKHIWRLDSLSEGTRFRNGAIENAGSGTAWSDIRYMYLNNQGLGGILKIKQILLFPTALSDADCITLTTL